MEGQMHFKLLGLSAWAAVFIAFTMSPVPTAHAQQLEDRIRTLEEQLSNLKEQQIELKTEATAAAAAMPAFNYRPGNGLLVEATDKSWSLRTGIESHFRLLFQSGRDQVGRTNGEVFARRFRPNFYYCINNCLWELEVILDLDGFGTGTGKNETGTAVGSMLHRGALNVHLETLNTWLPTIQLGMDVSASIGTARQGSSSTGAQAEYDLLSRNIGFDDGRSGNGILLNWDDRSLSAIGIPGRISRLQLGMANVGEGDDGLSSFTDRKDFVTYSAFNLSHRPRTSGSPVSRGKWALGSATWITDPVPMHAVACGFAIMAPAAGRLFLIPVPEALAMDWQLSLCPA
jgi:hypothetical protein